MSCENCHSDDIIISHSGKLFCSSDCMDAIEGQEWMYIKRCSYCNKYFNYKKQGNYLENFDRRIITSYCGECKK